MYHINSKVDKPDINYMRQRVEQMMRDGIRLGNVEALYRYSYDMQMELANEFKNKYGISNPNSSQQIVKYLQSLNSAEVYEVCCIDGKWTSNKDALNTLSLLGYEFAKDLLEYRTYKKYAESIKSLMDARDIRDGLVHPKVSLGKTNRVNYSDPALMNIPKNLLWYVIAPRVDGNVLYSVDIKNQEPNILINILGANQLKGVLESEKGLYESLYEMVFTQKTKLYIYVTENEKPRIIPAKEMVDNKNIPPIYYTPIRPTVDTVYYNNERVVLIEVCNTITKIGGEVIYPLEVAIETEDGNVYKVPVIWDEVSKAKLKKVGIIEVTGELVGLDIRCSGVYRKEFKQAWNALTYGASIYGVKRLCKHIDGELVYKYFTKIQEFKKYRDNCSKLASNGIQTINTFFGTTLTADEYNESRLQRVLMDLPIQGTGADILSLLIKHFDNEIRDRGLEGKVWIYYTRHDELIIEVSQELFNSIGDNGVKEILRDILEHQIDDWTPFKIEINKIELGKLDLEIGNDIEEDVI